MIGRHFGDGILKPIFWEENRGICRPIACDFAFSSSTGRFGFNWTLFLDLMANSNTTLASLWVDDGKELFSFSVFGLINSNLRSFDWRLWHVLMRCCFLIEIITRNLRSLYFHNVNLTTSVPESMGEFGTGGCVFFGCHGWSTTERSSLNTAQ